MDDIKLKSGYIKIPDWFVEKVEHALNNSKKKGSVSIVVGKDDQLFAYQDTRKLIAKSGDPPGKA